MPIPHHKYKHQIAMSAVSAARQRAQVALDSEKEAVAHNGGLPHTLPMMTAFSALVDAYGEWFVHQVTKPEVFGDGPHPQQSLDVLSNLVGALTDMEALVTEDLRQHNEWNDACRSLPAPRPREVRPVEPAGIVTEEMLASTLAAKPWRHK